jgi:DNA invertase Pin-like site-specific DNA recombinase
VQLEAIRKWARANKCRIVVVFRDEGESGSLLDREGCAGADAVVRDKSVAGIVVYRFDRLARDMLVQEQLMSEVWRHGGEIYATAADEHNLRDDPEEPSRKRVRRMMGVIAEYERDMIVLRMRRGRRYKAAKGG